MNVKNNHLKIGKYLSIDNGDPSKPMIAVDEISRDSRNQLTCLHLQIPKPNENPTRQEIIQRVTDLSRIRSSDEKGNRVYMIFCPTDKRGRKEFKSILSAKGMTLVEISVKFRENDKLPEYFQRVIKNSNKQADQGG